jgi:hypothetical protein
LSVLIDLNRMIAAEEAANSDRRTNVYEKLQRLIENYAANHTLEMGEQNMNERAIVPVE